MPYRRLTHALYRGHLSFFKAAAPKHMMPIKAHTHEDMLVWLRTYVNSHDFFKGSDRHALKLVSEATFWSVQVGLDAQFAKMGYQEIREFQPYYTHFKQHTEYTDLINEVFRKLVTPVCSDEAFFAIEKAAWCVYMHNNSFETLVKETKTYDLNAVNFRSGY